MITSAALPLATAIWLAVATSLLLYARLTPLVFRLRLSPATAPLTLPVTFAVVPVVPSYTLLKVPPMAAFAVSCAGVIVTAAVALPSAGSW